MRIIKTGRRWSKSNGPDNFYGLKKGPKISQSKGIGADLTPEIFEEVRRKLGIKVKPKQKPEN